MAWLGAVVGPLEGLEGMLAARGLTVRTERRVWLGEGLHSAPPVALVLGLVLPLGREAQGAFASGGGEIEAEGDDVSPGDRVHRHTVAAALAPHRAPQSTSFEYCVGSPTVACGCCLGSGGDLHQEGRRRPDLTLVRRAGAQAPRSHRGLRVP